MKNKNRKIRLGIILIIACIPAFLALPIIPFLDMDGKTKITLTTTLLIIGEVLFYAGGFLVGKEMFSKYKSYFNPKHWFNKGNTKENLESGHKQQETGDHS